ncbi:MAG: hypothetical protein LUQ61_01800 [Methanoregulaceae archaeon]|nr:hypothetical protein [Methanoregulaceae archaeon]
MYAIRFYRMYDIGKEVDLKKLDAALATAYTPERAGFTRVNPKSILMQTPPLSFHLPPVNLGCDGREYTLQATARVYDIGAVSLCFILEDRESSSARLKETALRFCGQRGLDPLFSDALARIREILLPTIGTLAIHQGFYEDYTIYVTDKDDPALDPVVLLLGDERPVSHPVREDILKYSLSYYMDDRTILSWDAALIVSPDPARDIIELIEFANIQALELRYYDRVLTQQMEKMYDEIEAADRLSQFRRLRLYHSIMLGLMETQSEISDITDKVDNLIKVTEDVYYARVYDAALAVLRIPLWRESVDRRIEIIRQNYMMLSDEVNIQHSNFLELVIIILIAIEIILFIVTTFT